MDKKGCITKLEKVREIILLGTDKNKKGDLFNRLMYDVFHALGFGEPRYNIPLPGREIDLIMQHRTENRVALAECKAHQEKIGGADVNKFAGALDVERGKYESMGSNVVGYFISQSGFKDTVYEQERDRAKGKTARNDRAEMILLGPDGIVRELIQGNVICSLEQAASAVKCQEEELHLCEQADLLASEEGWIWVLYYSKCPKQAATHFAFVHADGNRLLNSIADKIIQLAGARNTAFVGLSYIKAAEKEFGCKEAQDAYFQYLSNELGEIQFEGMPADKEAGAVKVDLENIFVSLRFSYNNYGEEDDGFTGEENLIKEVLGGSQRNAILAKPGGGKSTLIRRIALAYAYPERRLRVDDGLPDKDWFPVYIRCRDLESNVTKSILEMIGTIVQRAEISKYKKAFEVLVENALQDGRILLLIDGLDEISEEKHRICLADQLRTFVATYPNVHLLITSRETGFRAVAGTIAGYCKQYTICGLEKEQIYLLSQKWHQAISGEAGQVKVESDNLCEIIFQDARIAALAENPLLLTTMLFVKRWVGYLPTKRCRLYEEMIKLLLVTWNAGAHDKLDMDETEPQLAYVAYYMMEHGQQKISRDVLQDCIIKARQELPEILGYTEVSPSKFIEQVEERSSLLIQMGYEENDRGQMIAAYEFSHLSFQEYLAAKAIVRQWTPDSRNMNLLKALKPHMQDEHWREVIPLAAFLAGREAQPLIKYLTEINMKKSEAEGAIEILKGNEIKESDISILHLANCIANEVPISRELLEESILLIVKRKRVLDMVQFQFGLVGAINVYDTIAKSKYGKVYRDVVKSGVFEHYEDKYAYGFLDTWQQIVRLENEKSLHLSYILSLLKSGSYHEQITGALLMMYSVFNGRHSGSKDKADIEEESMNEVFSILCQMLKSGDVLSIYTSAWCIAWSGYEEADIIPHVAVVDIANQLVQLWMAEINKDSNFKRIISWGVSNICMPGLKIVERKGLREAIEDNFSNPRNDKDRLAAVHLALITNYWSKEEVKEKLSQNKEKLAYPVKRSQLLAKMGIISKQQVNR